MPGPRDSALAGFALTSCRTQDAVFGILRDALLELVPGTIVIVNSASPDQEAVVTRDVLGLEDSILARAAKLLGFSISGKQSAVTDQYRDLLFRHVLSRIGGGLAEFAASEIPPAVARSVERLLGLHDVYVIGIADADTTFGNVCFLTREPNADLPTEAIEGFIHQCFLTLARIRATAELAESEERHRLLFENMAQGFAVHELIFDADGRPCDYRFLQVNPAFEKMIGLRAEDVVGHTVLDVLPNVEPSWIQRYGAVAATGATARFEDYARDLGRYYEVVAYSPQANQFATIVTDITERRAADEAMRAQRDLLERITETSPVGITVISIDGLITFANAAAERILGLTRDVISRLRYNDAAWHVVAVDGGPFADEELPFSRVLAAKAPVLDVQHGIEWPDGTRVLLSVNAAPIMGSDGEIASVVSTILDITDRKRAEETLLENEARYRALVDRSPLAIFVNRDDRVVLVNDECLRLFGATTPEQLLGKSPYDLFTQEFQATVRERIHQLRDDGQPVPLIEERIIRLDGMEVDVEVSAAPFADKGVNAIHVVLMDITERKATETELKRHREHLEELVEARTSELAGANAELDRMVEELQSLNEELEKTNIELREATAAKSMFLSSMSHELRTPLNSVIGFSDIIASGRVGPLTAEMQTQIEMINHSGKHLLALIDDVLDLSKIEAGRAEVNIAPFDALMLAQEVVASLWPQAIDKGIELRCECFEQETPLYSDVGIVRQILLNLVGNAIKFTDEGSVELSINRAPNGDFLFSVVDTGYGIAPENLPRVFEAFTQIDSPNRMKPQGTGLGLALSRQYAGMLDGGLTVRSQLGEGSTFILALPMLGA